MKSLTEVVLENEFEKYLIDDLKMGIASVLCLQCPNIIIKESLNIFEAMSQLDNFKEILDNIVLKFLNKLPLKFEEKEYNIKISNSNDFCNDIKVKINHIGEYQSTAEYEKLSADYKTVYMNLYLDNRFKFHLNTIGSLIMHELLHAYEDYCRLSNGRPSIFDELSNKYIASRENINNSDKIIRNLATLGYFLNDKERRAYISTMSSDILSIIDKIKPSYRDLKTDKVLKELKNTGVWKIYFDFGKFILYLDKIDDKKLEECYSIANTTRKEIKDYWNEIFKNKPKEKGTPPDKIKLKNANEIRKECKNVWNKFKKKFDSTFIKIYSTCIPNVNENYYD